MVRPISDPHFELVVDMLANLRHQSHKLLAGFGPCRRWVSPIGPVQINAYSVPAAHIALAAQCFSPHPIREAHISARFPGCARALVGDLLAAPEGAPYRASSFPPPVERLLPPALSH